MMNVCHKEESVKDGCLVGRIRRSHGGGVSEKCVQDGIFSRCISSIIMYLSLTKGDPTYMFQDKVNEVL